MCLICGLNTDEAGDGRGSTATRRIENYRGRGYETLPIQLCHQETAEFGKTLVLVDNELDTYPVLSRLLDLVRRTHLKIPILIFFFIGKAL